MEKEKVMSVDKPLNEDPSMEELMKEVETLRKDMHISEAVKKVSDKYGVNSISISDYWWYHNK